MWLLYARDEGRNGRTLVVAPDSAEGEGQYYLQIEPAAGALQSPDRIQRPVSAPPELQMPEMAHETFQHTAWFEKVGPNLEADLVQRSFFRLGLGNSFVGVAGLVRIRNEIYLGLVKETMPICSLGDKLVQRVTEVVFYSVVSDYFDSLSLKDNDSMDQSGDREQEMRHPCQDIMKYLSSGNFYLSKGMDLTKSQQSQHAEESNVQPSIDLDHCSDEFLFNRYLLKDLLFVRESLLPEEKESLDGSGLLLAMIQGFVGSHTIRLQNAAGTFCQLAMVSRLSCRRAGTRFATRGIDDEGNVANFVETELILDSPQYLLSFVQLRGSVPVFWEQPGVQGFTQRIEISRGNEATAPAFHKHFERLTTNYGNVEIINLLSGKEPENMLTSAYVHHFENSLDDLAEMVDFKNFDFHSECRAGNFDNLVYLYGAVAKFLDSSGYFLYQKDSKHQLLVQSGYVRTNCQDCLDRTNVVQTYFALRTIVRHCVEFLDAGESAFTADSEAAWRHLWSDNGDALSRIYAGSGAIRSSATRKGKQTLAGLLNDATKSVQRFVVNNFTDKSRQETIDIVLGSGVPEKAYLLRDLVREQTMERMRAREHEYTSPCPVHVHIGTWNVNGKLPGEDLTPWIDSGSEIVPEFVVIAFQEIVELTPQQIVVTDINRRLAWEEDALRTLRRLTDVGYVLVRSCQLVGASISVFVREDVVSFVRQVETTSVKTGLAGLAGNKGGAAIRLLYHDTPICFLTAHFAAGQSAVPERNRDYRTITEGIRFRGKSIAEHDVVLFAGDFNYRLDLDYETALSYLESSDKQADPGVLQELLNYDQLRKEQGNGRTFGGFKEGRISFPPTYKVLNGTANVYENEKGRIPSWCDRILYKSRLPLKLLDYSSAQRMVTSDHKPVKAFFQIEAVIVDHVKAASIRKEIASSLRSGREGRRPSPAPEEPLIDLSPNKLSVKPTFAASNPFAKVQENRPWWDNGATPIIRSPSQPSVAGNPFRESAKPASPENWTTFD